MLMRLIPAALFHEVEAAVILGDEQAALSCRRSQSRHRDRQRGETKRQSIPHARDCGQGWQGRVYNWIGSTDLHVVVAVLYLTSC
jgi:hypothetical protein